MNEIAVIKQLPVITEQIKKVGSELDKKIADLGLDKLVCNEDTRKGIAELRTSLTKEYKEFEKQRKEIKSKILEPYEEFNKIYEEEIKNRYTEADLLLKNKIDEVENKIKQTTKDKMIEFFEEYRTSKSIQKEWLTFDELNIKVGISQLTPKGDLIKKVKDEIKDSIETVASCISSISTMENGTEILAEYLKHKNLSLAIKEVNDRHMILDTLKESNQELEEQQEIEEQIIEKVDDVLQAPLEEKTESFEEKEHVEEVFEMTFKVSGTLDELREIKAFLESRGYNYEPITD